MIFYKLYPKEYSLWKEKGLAEANLEFNNKIQSQTQLKLIY